MSSEKPDNNNLGGGQATKKAEGDPEKQDAQAQAQEKKGPPGGYDPTPIPHAPPGYTVKITFHRATKLPMADLGTFSSDPYLLAQLNTDLPTRHKEDSPLRFRTRTLWKTTEPEWNEQWIVAHVPASGFKLKVRIYDEDSSDSDDRLGNVHIPVYRIDQNWEGIHDVAYKVKKRSGSWRAYFLRGVAVCMSAAKDLNARLYVSVEVLGQSPGAEGGRVYTIGPNYWCKNYSPLLGRLIGHKASKEDDEAAVEDETPVEKTDTAGSKPVQLVRQLTKRGKLTTKNHNDITKKRAHQYNFESNQIQLRGPVPEELYHRYVEFRPFVKSLYTGKGLRGLVLNKGLHMQHNRVYNYNRETKYGVFEEPCPAMTRKFLDLVHYDDRGRMFTYVLLLDGLMRFTETGKEFGIDHLSKHTMHSDVSAYIAYSGEFFVRRRKRPHRKETQALAAFSPDLSEHTDPMQGSTSPSKSQHSRPETTRTSTNTVREPALYELIIDNDSGTYRPNGKLLPILRDFLISNLPGLKVVTLDAVEDAEVMQRLKKEQRERKNESPGPHFVYTQAGSSSGSISTDDDERLDFVASAHESDNDAAQSPGDQRRPSHKLGEAVAPFLGSHNTMRHMVGAPGPGEEIRSDHSPTNLAPEAAANAKHDNLAVSPGQVGSPSASTPNADAAQESQAAVGASSSPTATSSSPSTGKRTGYTRERWNRPRSKSPEKKGGEGAQ